MSHFMQGNKFIYTLFVELVVLFGSLIFVSRHIQSSQLNNTAGQTEEAKTPEVASPACDSLSKELIKL